MSAPQESAPEQTPGKSTIAARRRARSLVMQALYQWQLARHSAAEIEAQFRVDNDFSRIDGAYFHELLSGVIHHVEDLDAQLPELLDRPVAELDPVEHAILRLSSYELVHRPDIPYKVVINEGIELAKTFGATDGHRFINGVLDKLAARLRTLEVRPRRP